MSRFLYQNNENSTEEVEVWTVPNSSFPIEDGEPRSDMEPISGTF